MKFFKLFKKKINSEQKIKLDSEQKINRDSKFYFSTAVAWKDDKFKLTFHKAIDRNGKFVWIDKSGFPEENESFYLIILHKLEGIDYKEQLIANSFNLFRNRQDFYSQYTFVRKVKNEK